MPEYRTPGVYVEERPTARPLVAVGSQVAAFVGAAPLQDAHVGEAYRVSSWDQFVREFVGDQTTSTDLLQGVYGYYLNGGQICYVANLGRGRSLTGTGRNRQGLDLLKSIDEISTVAATGFTDPAHHEALITHAETMRDRVAILDPPCDVADMTLLTKVATAASGSSGSDTSGGGSGSQPPAGLRPRISPDGFAAMYYPCIDVQDPLGSGLVRVPPSGHIAGIWARNDGTRGVHKAPANEVVRGALGLADFVNDEDQGGLNTAGINVIRWWSSVGPVVWGARTLAEDNSSMRYLNLRRFLNVLIESIIQGTRWVVFEPNGQALWQAVTRDVRGFLTRVWRDGALYGESPEQAFFVRCNEATNPPEERDAGRLICEIGVAPLRPAEFVVFRLTQAADLSQIETVGGTRV